MFTKLCQTAGGSFLKHLARNFTVVAVRKTTQQHRKQILAATMTYCTKNNVVPIAQYEEVKDLPKHPEKMLIDVRETEELLEFGQIPTSINIPLGVVSEELSPRSDAEKFKTKYGRQKPVDDTEVIFYCRSGRRSLMAAETAMALGYINSKNYQGSWLEWAEREGLPK